jgi:hypothetical protein
VTNHFSVDGTLIESYASIKSFRPQDEVSDDEVGNDFKPRSESACRTLEDHPAKGNRCYRL